MLKNNEYIIPNAGKITIVNTERKLAYYDRTGYNKVTS